jgi:lysophospholipase L1-like esterase
MKDEDHIATSHISTSNRFLPLSILCDELDGLSDFSDDRENLSLIQAAHKNNILSKEGFNIPTLINGHSTKSEVRTRETTHKVEIIGDSHLAGSVTNINQLLNSKFLVTSLIKSGAPISELTSTQGEVLKDLNKNDVIVLSGGANNMGNKDGNERGEIVKKITDFIQTYNTTNVIIIGIPHRFDLNEESGINIEIRKTNAELKELTNSYSHVSIIETEPNRELFTTHGSHLNKTGKLNMAKLITSQIYQFVQSVNNSKSVTSSNLKGELNVDISSLKPLAKVSCAPKVNHRAIDPVKKSVNKSVSKKIGVILDMFLTSKPGKDSCALNKSFPIIDTGNESTVEKNSPLSDLEKETRVSGRRRRAPITRSSDFLW